MNNMAEVVALHRLARIMAHESLNTAMLSLRVLKQEVGKIVWI